MNGKPRYETGFRAWGRARIRELWEFLRPMDVILSGSTASRGRVEELHAQLNGLLNALDEAQLHGPAAYVSMAIDTIRRDNPELDAPS